MNRQQRAALRTLQRAVFLAGIAGVAVAGPLDGVFNGVRGAERPAAAEFGTGPRASARQMFRATLQSETPLRLRQMQSLQVRLVDAAGRPVDDARIVIDGGMPEHRHGLPTQPVVKRGPGSGMYEIQGLRFSMGGWWELKLAIESPAGSDLVRFNLSL